MNETDDRILKWLAANNAKSSLGEPFEFYEHSFLLDPLTDFHPQQGTNKAAQVGYSETIGVIKSFYMAQEEKMNVIYTLPTAEFVNTFVPQKVDPILNMNRKLFPHVSGGVGLKHIGTGHNKRFVNFIGVHNPKSQSEQEEQTKGIAVTADLLVNDEDSRSDQFTLSQMRTRLSNSKYRGIWKFDNPTYPKKGADGFFQKSDQRHWFVSCHHCKHKQYLDWVRLDQHDFEISDHCFIDPVAKEFICGKCGKFLDNGDRILGEWVAKFPEITNYRGYWISQLMYVRHSVASILEEEENERVPRSQFYNFTLGKPYVGKDVQVTRESIISNIDSTVNMLEDNAMGVDQGKVKHYVIGNSQGIFLTGKTESWDEIIKLFQMYNARMVIDALPYQRTPKLLSQQYPGRVFRAFYKPESDQTEIFKFRTKSDKTIVLIRRDEAFDVMFDDFFSNKFPINIQESELEEYIDHVKSMYRVVEEDRMGNQRFTWNNSDDDHYAHASLYFRAALSIAKKKSSTISPPKQQGNRTSAPVIIEKGIDGLVMQQPKEIQQWLKSVNSRRY